MSTLLSRTVMFTDTRNSTKLYVDAGNDAAAAAIGRSLAISEAQISQLGGTVIKCLGDGLMAAFAAPKMAVSAAIAIQKAHTVGMVALGIGIQTGEVVERDADLFGDAPNVASRLCALALPGEILLGQDVAQWLLADEFHLQPIDQFKIKGKDRPIDVVRILWETAGDRTVFITSGNGGSNGQTRAHLKIVTGQTEFVVDDEHPQLTVGRENADLVLLDPAISRQHAVIRWLGGRFILSDKSLNGTTIRYDTGQESFIRREDTDIIGTGIIAFGPTPILDARCVRFECF